MISQLSRPTVGLLAEVAEIFGSALETASHPEYQLSAIWRHLDESSVLPVNILVQCFSVRVSRTHDPITYQGGTDMTRLLWAVLAGHRRQSDGMIERSIRSLLPTDKLISTIYTRHSKVYHSVFKGRFGDQPADWELPSLTARIRVLEGRHAESTTTTEVSAAPSVSSDSSTSSSSDC